MQLVKEALGNRTSHYLRHSRASHLANIFRCSAYEIQKMLGHALLETSNWYVKVQPADLYNKLGEAKTKLKELELQL
jgi:integrase